MEESNHFDHTTDSSTLDNDNSHGWQKVTYPKRRKSQQQISKDKPHQNGSVAAGESNGNVFRAIEEQSQDRRRRVVEAQRAADAADLTTYNDSRSNRHPLGDDSDEDEDSDGEKREVVEAETKKKKPKKEKKPKVTVAEAAAKIDPADLEAFIAEVTASYGSQEDIQLMRFADFFSRAFSGVGAAQFPWVKIFRESTLPKLTEIPLSNIPEAVYKTSVDWINQRSVETLKSFILQLLDEILVDLASQGASVKGSKKGGQQVSSKSKVAVFVVLAMVLRRKPDALMNVLPTLRDNSKYQGQDKLSVIVWMISQASQGDLPVGLYAWASYLLPILNSKSGNNPQSRDLILQLVERIVTIPKARTILTSNAVRKGERLISPAAFDILIRVTFPARSARIRATERFEAVYPTLKDVALTGVPGSKAMKQVSQHIFNIALKAAGEGIPELSKEASWIFVWCLGQNVDCYKQWDKLYLDNLEASVAALKKLSEQWKDLSLNPQSREALKATLQSFQQKNEKALTGGKASEQALFKEAEKYCKVLSGRLSRGHGCIKAVAVLAVAVAVGYAVTSPDLGSLDLKMDLQILTDKLNSLLTVGLEAIKA